MWKSHSPISSGIQISAHYIEWACIWHSEQATVLNTGSNTEVKNLLHTTVLYSRNSVSKLYINLFCTHSHALLSSIRQLLNSVWGPVAAENGLKVKMSIWSINISFISVTNPEGDLQVLSSPDVHACVVRSNLLKVISVYREQSTCHGWSPAQKHTHTQNANQPLQLMDHLLNKRQSSLFFSWPSLSPLHSVSEEQTNTSFKRMRSYLLHFYLTICYWTSVFRMLCSL